MKLESLVNFKSLKAKKINLHRKLLNLVIKSEKIHKLEDLKKIEILILPKQARIINVE